MINYVVFLFLIGVIFGVLFYYKKMIKRMQRIATPLDITEKNEEKHIYPVFQIIYKKEELDSEDIPMLADYVINFDDEIKKRREDDTEGKTMLAKTDNVFVKYNNIEFNNYLKLNV